MSTREVVFLGTASQVPTRTRNHNAAFLAWDDLGIVFDPGEGTQRQMTLAGIASGRITHVVVGSNEVWLARHQVAHGGVLEQPGARARVVLLGFGLEHVGRGHDAISPAWEW